MQKPETENYLELKTYQDELVRQGIKAAETGKYVETSALKKRLVKLASEGKRYPRTRI
jgi:predicted transcriptional regulator